MARMKRGYTQRSHIPETFTLSTEERLVYLANLIVDCLEMGMDDGV